MNSERIKARLAKLLRVASDSSASPGEVENALKLAGELMAEHHLSPEDVADGAGDEQPMGSVTVKLRTATFPRWRGMLANFAADVVGGVLSLKGVKWDAEGRRCCRLEFVGRADEAAMAGWTYELLVRAIMEKAAERKLGKVDAGKGAAYAYGFVLGLAFARRAAMRALRAGSATAAMQQSQLAVVVDAKVAAAEQWAAAEHVTPIRKEPKVKPMGVRAEMTLGVMDGRVHQVQVERPRLMLEGSVK